MTVIPKIDADKLCVGSRNGEAYNRIKDADQICDALEKLGNVFEPVEVGKDVPCFNFNMLFETGDIICFPKNSKVIKTSFEMEDKKVEFEGILVNIRRGEFSFQRPFYPIYLAKRYIYCEVRPLVSHDEDGNEIQLNEFEVDDEFLMLDGSATEWYESLKERSDREVIDALCSDNKEIKVTANYGYTNDWQSNQVMFKRVYRFDFI